MYWKGARIVAPSTAKPKASLAALTTDYCHPVRQITTAAVYDFQVIGIT